MGQSGRTPYVSEGVTDIKKEVDGRGWDMETVSTVSLEGFYVETPIKGDDG